MDVKDDMKKRSWRVLVADEQKAEESDELKAGEIDKRRRASERKKKMQSLLKDVNEAVKVANELAYELAKEADEALKVAEAESKEAGDR